MESEMNLKKVRMIGIIIFTSLIVGCGESVQSVNSVAAKPDNAVTSQAPSIRVALIMKTLTNPFFIEMENGARQAQKETGIDLQVLTASQETSIEQQIQLVENQIENKVDAIVIAPGDSKRLVPAIKKAQDSGIKVVNIDNQLDRNLLELDHAKAIPFISVDNENAAYMSAKYVADMINNSTEAAIFEGIRSADNANQRKRGAERAFKENGNIQVVASESANWKIDEAYITAKQVFGKYPKIGLVFCANDMMAIGVIKYLQETGRKKVLVASFDALDEAKNAIRHGQMAATVDQQAAQQGYMGVMTALKLLRNETVPEKVEVLAKLITANNLK
jgi:ribose transport system substrate-binding protein